VLRKYSKKESRNAKPLRFIILSYMVSTHTGLMKGKEREGKLML
jgi:hypothetical protein